MPDSLRIAVLSVHSCPMGRLGTLDTGGMSVYIMELTRELARRGHVLDIFTRAHEPTHDPVVPVHEKARLVHLQAGENGSHKLVIYAHLQDFACQVEQFRSSGGHHYDLIFSHYWLSAMVGDILRGWWEVPHLVTFHTVAAAKNAVGAGEEEPDLRVEAEREMAGKCDRIIAATEKEKRAMLGYWNVAEEKIGIVPCGVNLERFHIRDRTRSRQRLGITGRRVLACVGRIEPAKGIDRLIQAVGLLADPGLDLVIIGGDEYSRPETQKLQELARQLRLEKQVRFVGLVEQGELPVYYNAADVTVVSSHYESFGLVALESMACGTPVVTTRVGGAEQIVRQGENGYLVSSNDAAPLAEGISRALTGSARTDREAVRQSVASFGWSNVADRIMIEFDRAMSDSRLAGTDLRRKI